MRRRGARQPHPDLPGQRAPLRDRRDHRPRAGRVRRVRGAARRRAALARRETQRVPAVADPHAAGERGDRARLRLLPRDAAAPRAVHAVGRRPRPRRGRRRAVRLRAAHARLRPRRLAARAAAARRPGLRRRGLARDGEVHPRAPRRVAAAGPRGRGLRGVRAAVSRGVGAADAALAAVDAADGDDLRRPRRPRRLEHLRGVAGEDAHRAVVAGPHRGRAGDLLDLPAPRQPVARRARAGRAAAPRARGRRRGRAAARVRAGSRLRRRRRALELRPRVRRRAARRARRPRGSHPAGGQPLDVRRARVGLGLRAGERRLRAPDHRQHAARADGADVSLARGHERGAVRRRLGPARRARRRERAPGARPRALGGVPGLLSSPAQARARGRRGRTRRSARLDHVPRRRRPPGLPARGGLPRRRRRDAAPSTRRSARRCATR